VSPDPHAPTPAGPDPGEQTAVHAAVEPTPVVPPVAAAGDAPAGGSAPESPWLAEPDPAVATPSAFTPPGTPAGEPSTAGQVQAQAQALTERPEAMVGLAFVGGVAVSLVLKRFGR
jgi:hypothetical protein